MRVRELMTPDVVVVSPDTPVSEGLATMRARGFRSLPVIGADRRPVGLLLEAPAAAAAPSALAKDAMSTTFLTARPDEPVYDVLNRCTWAMQDVALVIDGGALVGILAEYDAVKQAAQVLPDDLTVEDHASTSLLCIDAQRPAKEGLERMQRAWAKDMVVLEGRRLLGILSQRECIAARVVDDPSILAGALAVRDPNLGGCVQWDASLRQAAAIAVRDNVGCVPVVSDDGQARVEAVVSRGDIVRALLASGAVGEGDLSVEAPPE
jgi:CBS domain-containing protein